MTDRVGAAETNARVWVMKHTERAGRGSRWFARVGLCVAALLTFAGCAPVAEQASAPPPRAQLSAALAGRGDALPAITVVAPADGATVTSPVALQVKFEQLAPTAAGATVDGEGHLHVLIDRECSTTGSPIPKDDSHVHFGDGAADIEVELEPGRHELCVQVGDGFHAAVAVTDSVTVNVVNE